MAITVCLRLGVGKVRHLKHFLKHTQIVDVEKDKFQQQACHSLLQECLALFTIPTPKLLLPHLRHIASYTGHKYCTELSNMNIIPWNTRETGHLGLLVKTHIWVCSGLDFYPDMYTETTSPAASIFINNKSKISFKVITHLGQQTTFMKLHI